jgi:hypothetical protein
MTSALRESYDELPYPSFSSEQTHPDRLATLGLLFGLTPTPIDRCRVLEMGCSAGGNLIPMAATLPHSEFVGIDFSATTIGKVRPVASPVATLLAGRSTQVTNLRHEWITLDDEARRLLPMLTGNRTEQELATLAWPTEPEQVALGKLRQALSRLARQALLVG